MNRYSITALIGMVTGAVLGWFYGCFIQIWNHHVVEHAGLAPNQLITIWIPGHVPSNLVLPKVAFFAAVGLFGMMGLRALLESRGIRAEHNINELLATAFGIEALFVGGLTMWQDLLYPFGGIAILVAAFVAIFVYPAAIEHVRYQEHVLAHAQYFPNDNTPVDEL